MIMAISLDLFASRLDHACKDMEDGMMALRRAFEAEIAVLGAAVKGLDPHEQLATRAIFDARLADMERRLGEALSA